MMVRGFAVLIACQLAGEIVAHLVPVAMPGPVVGLLLLAVLIVAIGPVREQRLGVGPAADAVLASLGLLFVPAGVGVIQLLPLLGSHPAALLAVIAISTTITMLVTVAVYLGVKRLMGGARG